MVKIEGGGREETNLVDPSGAPAKATPNFHMQAVSFCEDKEDYTEGSEKFLMVQFMGVSQRGPVVLTRIYRGTDEIDETDIRKKMEKMKSSIILANKSNEVQQDLDNLNEILTEDMDYAVVQLYSIFKFA